MMNILKYFFLLIISCAYFSGCSQPNAIELDSIIYESCCGSEPVEITVFDTSHVYVPNVFTPNGDSINDKFRPYWSGELKYIQYMIVYSVLKDTIYFILDGTNFIGHEGEDFGWDGIKWETQEDEKHIGGFSYEIVFRGERPSGGTVIEDYQYKIEGTACVIECGPDAAVFQERVGCFFPAQHGSSGNLDPNLPNNETNCFNE